MVEPVRFFFDQHLRNSVAAALRQHGVDVITAHECNRCGWPDDAQIRFATAIGRSVVTFDVDYVTLAADFQVRGEAFAGVVFCQPEKYQQNPGRLLTDLLTLHGVYAAADMLNHLEYL